MKIAGTGCSHPIKIVSNELLSTMVDTNEEWIVTRTGIQERRVISEERLEDLAAEASRRALENAGMDIKDIDLIICANVVNEYITPALSCIVQGMLGATCPCIDVNGACVGFVYGIDMAEAYYKCGKVENVLVVCAEEPSRMVGWDDRATCVLFGDGAGAAVLTKGDNIKASRLNASCSWDKLYQKHELQYSPFNTKPNSNLPLVMRGQDVFKFAINASMTDITCLLEETKLTADDIDLYLLHQANMRIISSVRKNLKQSEDKFPTNIHKYGNTSSASLPILLDELNRSGALKKGNLLALSAFGAGFVSGACILEW